MIKVYTSARHALVDNVNYTEKRSGNTISVFVLRDQLYMSHMSLLCTMVLHDRKSYSLLHNAKVLMKLAQ